MEMSQTYYGMDVTEVRGLATQLDQKAEEIEQIISTIGSKLTSTPWTGPDATKFRSEWDGSLTTQLRQVATVLRDTATNARNNASQQEQASAN
jgi:uncharacterized protein YukE